MNSPVGLLLAFHDIVRNCFSPETHKKIKNIHKITSYMTYVRLRLTLANFPPVMF